MTPKTHSSKSSNKTPVDVIIAKYGLLSTITVAILGLIGTGITAYLGFLGIQAQIEKPIIAKQTAEAEAIMATQVAEVQAMVNATQGAEAMATINAAQTADVRAMVDATQSAIQSNIVQYTIVYPSCNCDEYLMPDEKVLIRLRWGGKTAELAEKGADFIKYVVTIDGQDIGDIQNYRRQATLVKDRIIAGDPNNAWWVYWDIPVGRLSGYSLNTIEAKIKLLAGIDTGWDMLPVGLERTYRVILHMSFLATQTAPPTP
jgi:hypothetical protein